MGASPSVDLISPENMRTATAVVIAAFAILVIFQASAEQVASDEIVAEASLVQEDASKIADAGMGGVEHVIPKFQTGAEWAQADQFHRAAYAQANSYYAKTHE